MSLYPADFTTETSVDIDAYDLIDYVRDNAEFFKEKCGLDFPERTTLETLRNHIEAILSSYWRIARLRESEANKDLDAVKLYDDIEKLLDTVKYNLD